METLPEDEPMEAMVEEAPIAMTKEAAGDDEEVSKIIHDPEDQAKAWGESTERGNPDLKVLAAKYDAEDAAVKAVLEPTIMMPDKLKYDASGRMVYFEACYHYGVTAVSSFVKNIESPEIRMPHRGIGPRGAKALAKALTINTHVLRLDISDNGLLDEGVMAICSMLKENCYVNHLWIGENNIRLPGCEALREMLKSNTYLTFINCQGNKFGKRCAAAWADVISSNLHLTELVLSHNEFDVESAAILGPAIAENERLQKLDLSWNHFRLQGALDIAMGMKDNQFLKVFNLAWNGFADEGAMAVAEALKVNDRLEEIDLRYNRISDGGATAIAKALAVNDTLRILKLGNNPIQTNGLFAILKAIKSNPNSAIEELHFDDVMINHEILKLIEDLRASNPKLKVEHGGLGGKARLTGGPGKRDPMVIIKKYIDSKNLRLVDFFNSIDKDKSMTVTVQEFEQGLAQARIPLSAEEIRDLVKQLDLDGDGEIDYSELVEGATEVTLAQREEKKKAQAAAAAAAAS